MRYILGFLIGIGLIVLTFILIFKAFSGGDSAPKKIDLNSYADTGAVMRLTIDGPVKSNEEHKRLRITVSRDQVLYEEIQGYQGTLKVSQTYPSNPEAYAAFLHSLTIAGFTKGLVGDDAPKDERGYCPLGNRYIYEASSAGENFIRWWSTSCSSSQGTFRGQSGVIRSLFKQQVPDYGKINKTGLS